ncbi:MAG: bifunctional phosphoribosyl-AMP cyclohydrolase/phosphoribosyl-ATP diphosphatase HisIE [Lachnospiraceae bacterium]|nr:bifunctional phosphoribosyl-AMP cyclohydrolase/phosphoribosyl-ATP diphosphatase HisIE [Lachnospiraceae bacterium]
MKKKLMASIFLSNSKAVIGYHDLRLLFEDPVQLALKYSEYHADELLITDLSETDEEREHHLDLIKEICDKVQIPVMGSCQVKKMEDVKKLLYAGCKKAMITYIENVDEELTKEVSLKFGKEKIAAAILNTRPLLSHSEFLADYISELVYLGKKDFKEAYTLSPVPVTVWLPDVSLDKLIETLAQDNVIGAAGEMINKSIKEIDSLKMLLNSNGIPMAALEAALCFEEFKKNSDGMVPVIVQDYKTDQVLMLAYMNKEAYEKTLATGKMTYWSRSRDELWIKGDTSGHYQYVKSLTADCDKDTILARVSQTGAACHTGEYSCFFHKIMEKEDAKATNPLKVFEDVFAVIMDRKLHPKEGSYTNYLFDKGVDKILKKLGEEATEIVIAAKNPNANEIKYEISDFLYHMMVLMAEKGVTWEEIVEELAKR